MAFGRTGRDFERVAIRGTISVPAGSDGQARPRGQCGERERQGGCGRVWTCGERASCSRACSDRAFLVRLPVPSGSCLVPRTTWCTSGTCRPRRSYRNYRATQVSAGPRAGRTPTFTQPGCVVMPSASRLPRPPGGPGDAARSERLARGFVQVPVWPGPGLALMSLRGHLPGLKVHVGSVCGRGPCVSRVETGVGPRTCTVGERLCRSHGSDPPLWGPVLLH